MNYLPFGNKSCGLSPLCPQTYHFVYIIESVNFLQVLTSQSGHPYRYETYQYFFPITKLSYQNIFAIVTKYMYQRWVI